MVENILSIVFLGIITYSCLLELYTRKKNDWAAKAAEILYFPVVIIGFLLLDGQELLVGLYQFLVLLVAVHFIFDISWKKECLFLILQQFIFLAAASMISGMLLLLDRTQRISVLLLGQQQGYEAVISIMVYGMIFLLMHLLCRIMKRQQAKIPGHLYLALVLGGLLNIATLIINARLVAQAGLDTREAVLGSLLPVVLFLFYVMYFMLLERFTRVQEQLIQQQAANKYAARDVAYYERLEVSQQEIRRLHHDMRNHLLLMEQMQEEKKKNYAEGLLHELDQKQYQSDGDNGIADIIFWEKKEEARAKGIELQVAVERVILKRYPEIPMCTILTNAIDNGMEACQKSSESNSEPVIRIKGMRNSLGVILTFENPMSEQEEMNWNKHSSKGNYTSKPDSSNHGMGLGNIRRAVEVLEGSMDIRVKEQQFRLTILLPDPETDRP